MAKSRSRRSPPRSRLAREGAPPSSAFRPDVVQFDYDIPAEPLSDSPSEPIFRERRAEDWTDPFPRVVRRITSLPSPNRQEITPRPDLPRRVVARKAKLYSLPRAAQVAYRGFRQDSGRPPLSEALGVVLRHPKRTYLCVRRYIRRKLLFAFGVAGSGRRRSPGKGPPGHRYKRTQDSIYSCFRRR